MIIDKINSNQYFSTLILKKGKFLIWNTISLHIRILYEIIIFPGKIFMHDKHFANNGTSEIC